LWVDLDNADYIRESLDLPGCRLALRVDRTVRSSDGVVLTHDVRYFISSLDPGQVTAAELLQHVRHHWRLENGLHFLKDRWWDEDRHHTRRPGLSACLAAINNAAVSIHRLQSDATIPLRAAADYIAWDPARGLAMLNT
jgi:predicted transposase YbfD/YdcC